MSGFADVVAGLDFEIADVVEVASATELATFLRERGDARRIRLCGTASRQLELPPPREPVTLLGLSGLDRIARLERDDLTCSVEPGVRRSDLDAALKEVGLWLPCAGEGGTVGGLFATGADCPPAPGALSSRSVLLGLEGALAEGLPFKCGARVVKNVAGFDLPKLFVGSRGRLFAATLLHLKLRALPPRSAAFELRGLERDRALELFRALRLDSFPPLEVRFVRDADGGFALSGRYGGAGRIVDGRLARHELDEVTAITRPEERTVDTKRADELELLTGLVRPSRIPELLEALPTARAMTIGGTGCYEVWLARADSDAVLARLSAFGASGVLRRAGPERRGRGTPLDPGADRLMQRLTRALDPEGRLT